MNSLRCNCNCGCLGNKFYGICYYDGAFIDLKYYADRNYDNYQVSLFFQNRIERGHIEYIKFPQYENIFHTILLLK